MKRALFLAIGFVAALAWAAPAAADTIAFDMNGTGTGGAMTLDHFDWDAGNSMIIENADGSFTLLYQANLDGAIGTDTSYLDCSLTGDSCLTAVASFSVTEVAPGFFTVDSGGTFAIYADSSYADDYTGGGAFVDGTPILTGTATGTGTINFGFNPVAPVDVLDQHNTNNWGGYFTLEGAGGFTNLQIDISTWNTDYFLSSLSSYSLAIAINNGSNGVPYFDVDPTRQFWNGVAGVPNTCGPGQTAGVNCVNGTGSYIMAQSDATTTFRLTPVTAVPEPATLTLLGLGLAGSAAVRRRQLRKKKKNQ